MQSCFFLINILVILALHNNEYRPTSNPLDQSAASVCCLSNNSTDRHRFRHLLSLDLIQLRFFNSYQ